MGRIDLLDPVYHGARMGKHDQQPRPRRAGHVYGFRNRKDFSYDQLVTATSEAIRIKRVWDYLSDAGKQSVIVGVPQTYPVRPLNGYAVSD